MKSFFKPLAALLLVAMLLPAALSCGKREERLEEAPVYYSADFKAVESDFEACFRSLATREKPYYTVNYNTSMYGALYYTGNFLNSEQWAAFYGYDPDQNFEEENENNQTPYMPEYNAILLCDPQTMELRYTELRVDTGSGRIREWNTGQEKLLCVTDEGEFICMENHILYNEKGDPCYDTNMKYDDLYPDNRWYLTRYDKNGVLTKTLLLFDIDQRLGGKGQKALNAAKSARSGDKLYLYVDSGNARYQSSPAFLAELDLNTNTLCGYVEIDEVFRDSPVELTGIITRDDGQVCALLRNPQTQRRFYCTADSLLHPAEGKEGEAPELTRLRATMGGDLIALYEDKAVFATLYGVYRENVGGEEDGYESLFSWLDVNISGAGNNAVGFTTDTVHWISPDKMVVAFTDSDTRESFFVHITRSDTPVERTQQRMFVAYDETADYQSRSGAIEHFLDLAARFNRTNSDYRIVLYPYTGDSVSSANEKLKMDLVSGRVPDMILFGGSITSEPFVRMEEFVDLYSLIDADDTYTRDAFLPCALKPFETAKGQLPYLPLNMTFHTAMGLSSATGGKTVWTMDDFENALNNLGENQYLIRLDGADNPQMALLETFLPAVVNQYVDYEKKTTDFRGDFKRFLALCKDAPVLASDDYPSPNEYSAGNILLRDIELKTPNQYMRERIAAFGDENVTLIGAPRSDGASLGSAIATDLSIAIMRVCPNQQAAWEFIKSYLDNGITQVEACRNMPNRIGMLNGFLPIRATLDLMLELSAVPEYQMMLSENGENVQIDEMRAVQYPITEEIDPDGKIMEKIHQQVAEEGYTIHWFAEADIALFRQLAESSTAVWSRDQAVLAILYEEASAYFAGARDLDETIRLMENRVKTRINE